MQSDQDYMQLALEQAQLAQSIDEVPVGAVLIKSGEVIASGFNQPIKEHDATCHAEIIAIRSAGKVLNNYRLSDCTLYVTLEPCLMCIGAIVHARIKRLVFGAYDAKTGVVESVFNIDDLTWLNHKISCEGGILEGKCGRMLSDFFKEKRNTRR